MSNESIAEYTKIGFTYGDVTERIKQLVRTGVPLPFEIYYAASVNDAATDEKWLHSLFSINRARSN